MKIIKKGIKPFEELEFTCAICSCVFKAEFAECQTQWSIESGNTASCQCPTCKAIAFSHFTPQTVKN